MCGIAGFVDLSETSHESKLGVTAGAMAAALRHRGPDDCGVWTDQQHGIALAHARLSILDVSTCGHQPMVSSDGRFVMVFNGEIYNFREIRAQLTASGHSFRSHSDTEVLLAAISEWGIHDALERAVGMFALGVWDRAHHTLVLARDRLGEKPLYYGWTGSAFIFASELKALRVHPKWSGGIDREALTLYLRNGYVPAPFSIYSGIHKLKPGCLLTCARFSAGTLPEPAPYWRLPDGSSTRHQADHSPTANTDECAVDTLDQLLRQAVQQQMIADVPLGAFLSGGIDSATIVALMQSESSAPVRTFTIGVSNPAHDETSAARSIARHIGTEHTDLRVESRDVLAVVPRLGVVYDEPFADSSQIPTLLVSQLARRSVTVSLSGDGGDELFGGYERYVRAPALVGWLGLIPASCRYQLARVLLGHAIARGFNAIDLRDGGRIADRALRLGEILAHESPLAVHRALHSSWPQPAAIVRGGSEPPTLFTSSIFPWSRVGVAEQMLVADAATYLPDDLLVKVDRAAMSVGLETRVPMLDHRVVTFALSLPWKMKVRQGVRKWILRQVLYRYVPQRLVSGPKKGFSVPIGEWLRGPLRDWASHLLDSDRLASEGFFAPEPIRRKWIEHLKGTHDWSSPLWAILMFQAWYEAQLQ